MIPRTKCVTCYVAAAILVVSGVALGTASGQDLRIGMAESDITPPNGFPMAGYYHERLATGTLNPLKAKAVVFQDHDTIAAWVACDLTGIAVDLTMEVRRRAEEVTGIPARNIAISASHSHTAPDYTKDLYLYVASVRQGKPDENAYSAKLIAGIVDSIKRAKESAAPATLEAGSVLQQVPVSFNRRFVMRDGSVRTWMRLDNPEVVRAAGPIDPEISLVRFRRGAEGETVGVLSNFALHLDTVGGTQWSADYPFYIEQSVRRLLGPNVVSLFGTGCCGDINHSDPVQKERNKTDMIGESLGKTIVEGIPQLAKVERRELRVRSKQVNLPLQDVSAEQVARSQPLVAEARAGKQVEFFTLVTAYKSLMLDQLRHREPHAATASYLSWGLSHTWAGVGESLPADVQVVSLGTDVAVVWLPGEVFVDLGLAIKRASPFRTTLVVELSNCVESIYIPHRAAYAGGSYEVTNSAVKPGSGEMLVEAALELLREVATEAQAAGKEGS